MSNRRLVSLTIRLILATVPGISPLILADIASETDTKAQQHFQKANELRKLANYKAAVTEYEKVISLSPNSEIAQNAQYWIGQSCFRAGQFDAALSAFQKLLDEYPASSIVPSTKLMMERAQQAKKNKSLFEAAVDGDIEQIKLLLTSGTNVNIKDRRGRTALYLAAEKGHADVVKLLIDRGADVNARQRRIVMVPLHRAAIGGHSDVVKLLIDHGADVNAKDRHEQTPLHFAAGNGDIKTIELLLSNGADINAKNRYGSTPLFAAMTSTSAGRKVAELLVAKGAKIPALQYAAYIADMEKIKKCLQDGTDINSQEDSGSTALHISLNFLSAKALRSMQKTTWV
jgi:ankyrin repeat protein